jgi:hypothetical protein
MEAYTNIILMLIPLIVLHLGLQIYCLVDLIKRETVRGGNKIIWGVVIFAFNMLGPIVYLVIGRSDK